MMKARDLKNSILQLAVEGKLVPQNPNDEPASMLLERIREQKRQLIAEGKAKFPKGGESVIFIGSDGLPYEKRVDAKGRESEPLCIADEVPFEVPEGWCWTRLEELASFSGGKTPPTNDRSNYEPNGILWVTSKDMKRDFIDSTLITLSEKGASELTLYPVGTILMVTRSGILRRLLPVAMLVKEATVNQDQKAICPFNKAISRWLLTFFKASDYRIRADFGKAGTTVESIVFEKVKTMLVPLPPLAEQRRIVAKVEELVPLVEQYGALEDERERLDAALPNALRKSILQEAVEGRLVPQDASDEPASALLVRIREERRKMVAGGQLKPPKSGESVIFRGSDGRRYEKRVDKNGRESEPVCIEDEIPFEIPESWEWARFTELVPVQYGFPADSQLFDKDAPIGLIRIRDVNSGDLVHTVTGYRGEYPSECLIHAGDDLIGMDGEFACHRWKGPEALLNQRICCLRYLPEGLSSDFVSYAVNWYLEQIWKTTSKTTVKHLSAKALDAMLFAVPPLSEQERIVAKVKQLESITNR